MRHVLDGETALQDFSAWALLTHRARSVFAVSVCPIGLPARCGAVQQTSPASGH